MITRSRTQAIAASNLNPENNSGVSMNYIEAALNTAYTGGIEALVDANLTETGDIQGRFIGTGGEVFAYQIDPDGVEFQESHEDSEWINDYFSAKLAMTGVDYHGDSAFEYWKGRNGEPIRTDGFNCEVGVPCNGKCIPRGHKCRTGASGASGAALKQGGKGIGRAGKLALGAAVAGGIVAASLNRNVQAGGAAAGVVGRKIGGAVAGAAGKVANKAGDIANKAEARGREIMNGKQASPPTKKSTLPRKALSSQLKAQKEKEASEAVAKVVNAANDRNARLKKLLEK
jgi:hypothetical protein